MIKCHLLKNQKNVEKIKTNSIVDFEKKRENERDHKTVKNIVNSAVSQSLRYFFWQFHNIVILVALIIWVLGIRDFSYPWFSKIIKKRYLGKITRLKPKFEQIKFLVLVITFRSYKTTRVNNKGKLYTV